MPKLFEYFGVVVFFYSNEHEPVHVHGRHSGRETRAELVVENGRVVRINYTSVKGRRPLQGAHLSDFKVLVEHYSADILQKWIDYFVLHRPITPEKLTRRIR